MQSKGDRLCCLVNDKEITCFWCNETFCHDCGKAWGQAQHFILNMCRKRFFNWEVAWAQECYAKRKKKSRLVGLGDCFICYVYETIDDMNDRYDAPELNLWRLRTDHKGWVERVTPTLARMTTKQLSRITVK